MTYRIFGSVLCLSVTACLAIGSAFAATSGSDDYSKATELVEKKSFQEAIPFLDKAIQTNPKLADAYMDRALCNFHLGNYKKVLEDCKEVTALESAHQVTKRQAFMMSAGAHNALGEFSDAVEASTKAIGMAPHSSLCYSDRAFAYKQMSRFDEALKDVNEAIKLDPKHASNYELRASLYETMSKQDRAKYRQLIQTRKPGEKPWEKVGKSGEAKNTSSDSSSK
jgi:tetratricopeptide (TPR) repeat protein